MVTKEKAWAGLKFELPNEELSAICQADKIEKDSYYNLDLLIAGLNKAINREVDFRVFEDWCILVTGCLYSVKDNFGKKVNDLYGQVGYFFDGVSFMDEYNTKELLESLAMLKSYDYRIRIAKKEANGPFTTNGIERAMCFDHANWNYDTSVYKVIIRDYSTKNWEIRYADNHDFDFAVDKNYFFVEEDEFENIFNKFYGENSDWKEISNMDF